MQEKHLFEYAVVRVVPRVDREEFINVGVIVFCKKAKYLDCLFNLNIEKLNALTTEVDIEEIKTYLDSYKKICNGAKEGGPIAALDIPSRFRWLTATRSTVVQSSKIHPGFCFDLNETLSKLHEQLVL